MIKPRICFLIPAMVVLLFACETSDDTAIDPETLDKWATFNTSNGLADNQVWDITMDDNGHIWFATNNGVSRYNGNSWKTWRTGDGLINNQVYAVEQDVYGDMWFGTAAGFSIFDGSTFENFTGTSGNVWTVNCMLQASSGSFWVGTDGLGAYEITSDGIYSYYFDQSPALNYVQDIVEDDQQSIYASTLGGVIKGTATTLELISTSDGLVTNDIRSLLYDSWGTVWMGTGNAEVVNLYNKGKVSDISLQNGFPVNYVMAMVEDPRGNVWLGTLTVGVTKYDGAVMRTYQKPDGLASNRILSLAVDPEGNIWIGTYDSGVNRYTPGMD